MKDIRVVYSFARSGGTLVNQLLGAYPQSLVLSEVNPAACYKPIVEQAEEWLDLIAAHETQEFSDLSYLNIVTILYNRAIRRAKRLIIRDWVTVNYLPGCLGDGHHPSGQLEQRLYLNRAGFRLTSLVISRRSAAVYTSIKQHFSQMKKLEIDIFAQSYLKYARAVADYPIIHLEDLRAQPDATIKQILRLLNLDPDQSQALFMDFHNFKNCTGNTTLQISNESASAQKILPPEDHHYNNAIITGFHPAMEEADGLLNYV